jgi:hypothetical protein
MGISRWQFEQMVQRTGRVARAGDSPTARREDAPLESKLHGDIKIYCDNQWPRWKYVHSRMDRETTTNLGVPDFVIFMPKRRTVCIECKRPGKKLTTEQHTWAYEVEKLDAFYFTVHTMQEFLDAIKTVNEII